MHLALGRADSDWNGIRRRQGGGVGFGEPGEGFFEVGEGADVPSLKGADEGEFADTLVWVVTVEDGEALMAGEAGVVEGFDKGGEFVAREERLMRDRKGAEVQDGAVDTPFAAGAGYGVEDFAAGVKVKVRVGIETDEVVDVDDLQF
jgi:hypothetical protein